MSWSREAPMSQLVWAGGAGKPGGSCRQRAERGALNVSPQGQRGWEAGEGGVGWETGALWKAYSGDVGNEVMWRRRGGREQRAQGEPLLHEGRVRAGSWEP